MKILTEEGEAVATDMLPERITKRHYAALNLAIDDFVFLPMIFLDCFMAASVTVTFGNLRIRLPANHSIVITDIEVGAVEIIPIRQADNCEAFSFHPLIGSIAEGLPIRVRYSPDRIKWAIPRFPSHLAIAVPIDSTRCVYLAKSSNWPEKTVSNFLF